MAWILSGSIHLFVLTTLLPAHLSKNTLSSFRAASLKIFKFTRPDDRCAAIFPYRRHNKSYDLKAITQSRDQR